MPVVLGALPPEAAAVIERVADEQGAPVVRAGDGASVEVATDVGVRGTRLRLRTPARDYGTVSLALAGAHQAGNALVATRVLELLDGAGVPVPAEAVREGLAATRWPGRLDLRRLPDGREALLDAAHNPEGAQALTSFLASEAGEPRALVFAAMRDKDVTDMLRVLAPHVRALIMTRARTHRSAAPETLVAVARALKVPCAVVAEPSLDLALEAAWQLTPRIAIAGSIFLLGDVMKRQGWS